MSDPLAAWTPALAVFLRRSAIVADVYGSGANGTHRAGGDIKEVAAGRLFAVHCGGFRQVTVLSNASTERTLPPARRRETDSPSILAVPPIRGANPAKIGRICRLRRPY